MFFLLVLHSPRLQRYVFDAVVVVVNAKVEFEVVEPELKVEANVELFNVRDAESEVTIDGIVLNGLVEEELEVAELVGIVDVKIEPDEWDIKLGKLVEKLVEANTEVSSEVML